MYIKNADSLAGQSDVKITNYTDSKMCRSSQDNYYEVDDENKY